MGEKTRTWHAILPDNPGDSRFFSLTRISHKNHAAAMRAELLETGSRFFNVSLCGLIVVTYFIRREHERKRREHFL